jgi:regulator of sigma E protease
MNKIVRFLIGLLGLSIVIIVHEFGHFVACKFFGVQTPIFSIGFGPALASIQLGDTVFQIALLPLGGYVEINQTDFAAISYAAKMITLFAGIFFNLLFALIVFVYFAWKNRGTAVPIIATIIPDSPAAASDFNPEDLIISIDGQPVETVEQLTTLITQSPGKKAIFSVQRNGTIIEIPITIGSEHPILGPQSGWIGIHFKQVHKPQSLTKSLQEGAKRVGLLFLQTSYFMATFFKKNGYGTIVGPLGIIAITGQSLMVGFSLFFMILAILSINVAFFNLLPIPFFDGGKIALYTIETITGPLPAGAINLMYIVFFIIFMLLILLITFRDITRLRK